MPPYKVQVLHLHLFQNPTLILNSNAYPLAVGDYASSHHVEISLVREETVQIAGNNVQKKAVLRLTSEEWNCLKADLLSTDTVFNYTAR